MSSVPGIVPNVQNNLVSTGGVPGRAIGLIGHRDITDVNVDTSVVKPYGATAGVILNYQSLGDWLTVLGAITATSWVDGKQDDDSAVAAIAPHSQKDGIMYALALIYAANPSANVYAAIIDGDANGITANDTTTLPTGASLALTDFLLYDDIGFVVIANIDPRAEGKTHAETATTSTAPAYNSPRFYVAGIDLFSAWDGVTYASSGAPLDATNDLSTWSGVKSDFGVVLNYVGNHDFGFGSVGDANTRQIGGQLVAAYIAGLFASRKDSFGATFSPMGLGATKFTVSDTDLTEINYIFSLSELDEAITDGWLITRFAQNSYVLAKGVTFASTVGSSWSLYPHRSITNFVHKSLVAGLRQFLGRQQTQATLAAAQKLAEGIMQDAIARLYLSSFNISVKPHITEVDAITVEVEFVTIKPINKIYLNLTVS